MTEKLNKDMKDTVEQKTDEVSKKGEVIEKNTSPSLTSKEKNVPVILSKEELQTLDYNSFDTPARMLALGRVLVKSNLVSLKSAEDVAVALMTGKELGLPFITSLSQIYPINGKPTLGVHIQRAILINNGIIFNKVEDAEPIYAFANRENNNKIIATGTIKEQPENTGKKRIDYRTTYTFSRAVKMANGMFKEISVKSSFTMKEAIEAELTEKDVWVKYWRRMLDARAFVIGAREIADDLLLGIMTPNELDEIGDISILDKEGIEIKTK